MLVGAGNTDILERSIAELAARYSMQWRVSYGCDTKRVAVLVSKLDHCLWDLLIRWDGGRLWQRASSLSGVVATLRSAVPGSELITASSLDLLMTWAGTCLAVDCGATVLIADDTPSGLPHGAQPRGLGGHNRNCAGDVAVQQGSVLNLLQTAYAHGEVSCPHIWLPAYDAVVRSRCGSPSQAKALITTLKMVWEPVQGSHAARQPSLTSLATLQAQGWGAEL